MFYSYYLSYFYCSSKLVLAHAVLVKEKQFEINFVFEFDNVCQFYP